MCFDILSHFLSRFSPSHVTDEKIEGSHTSLQGSEFAWVTSKESSQWGSEWKVGTQVGLPQGGPPLPSLSPPLPFPLQGLEPVASLWI